MLDPFIANFDFEAPHELLDPELDIYNIHVDPFKMGDDFDMCKSRA